MAIFLKKLKQRPKNILIARTDRIGDFILTLPVFEALGREPDISFSVLCQELVTPLLEQNPFVERIIIANPGKDRAELLQTIQESNFDALLVLVNDPIIRGLLPDLKKMIPVRIGPLSKLDALWNYTHPVLQKRSRSTQNEAEYNLELLEIFGRKSISPTPPKIYVTEAETTALRKRFPILSKDVSKIVFHAGMNGSALNWKHSNYQELLQELLKEEYHLFLTGASETEREINQKLLHEAGQSFSEQLHDFTGQLTLRELSILIAASDLFIGPSTGPTHIADAVGTPLISFYPPIQVQSATRWQPFMANSTIFVPQVDCGQKYRCLGEKCPHFYCMDQIDPEAVFNQAKEYIQK